MAANIFEVLATADRDFQYAERTAKQTQYMAQGLRCDAVRQEESQP